MVATEPEDQSGVNVKHLGPLHLLSVVHTIFFFITTVTYPFNQHFSQFAIGVWDNTPRNQHHLIKGIVGGKPETASHIKVAHTPYVAGFLTPDVVLASLFGAGQLPVPHALRQHHGLRHR